MLFRIPLFLFLSACLEEKQSLEDYCFETPEFGLLADDYDGVHTEQDADDSDPNVHLFLFIQAFNDLIGNLLSPLLSSNH